MRSFFNKPAWASAGGDEESEFYRRSEHTYSDIIAANREAAKKPKVLPEGSEASPAQGDKRSKRPRLSNESTEESLPGHEYSLPADNPEPRDQHDPSARPADVHTEPERTISQENDSLRSPTTRPSSNRSLQNSPVDHLERSPAKQEVDSKSVGHDTGSESTSQPFHPPAPLMDDPVVRILLTSEIPNTKPLIVHRKMSQALREVRQEWCRRQGFPEDSRPSIYLTWMGRRLFDVTTCRSLGVRPVGRTVLSNLEDDLDAGPKELQIHMEAVTDNQQLLGQLNPPLDRSASPAPPQSRTEGNDPMKLILRSPGRDDLKIKARPTTRVSKIVSAFRDKSGIDTEREVYLVFDGDRLDPDTSLDEHDITDLDLIDVQVK